MPNCTFCIGNVAPQRVHLAEFCGITVFPLLLPLAHGRHLSLIVSNLWVEDANVVALQLVLAFTFLAVAAFAGVVCVRG